MTACTSINSVVEINIDDFGARADDMQDDTPAVIRALEACSKHHTSRLIFPQGRYDFYGDHAQELYTFISNNDEGMKRVIFLLQKQRNLTIDGQGSRFIFHGFVNPFIMEDSRQVRFENFSVDFARTFHSEGIILKDLEEGLEIEFPEEYPFLIEDGILLFTDGSQSDAHQTTVSQAAIYGSNHVLEFDAEKRETSYMAEDLFFPGNIGYAATRIGDRTARLHSKQFTGKVGNTLVFGPNHRKHPAFVLTDSSDVIFENITIHHSGGMGILGQRSADITVSHCKVTPSPGRMLSTTADATHFVNCTGHITLSHNLFENQKDDATNIHGIYLQIAQKTAANRLILQIRHRQQRGFDFLQSGTPVEFVRGKSMITYAEATVADAVWLNHDSCEVTFQSALPGDIKMGDALAEIRDYPAVTITDNIIRNNRARGMLLNCRGKTRVENNYFHTPGAAILFEGDSFFWFEQGGVRDCVIRNNTFENCMFGVWGSAVIDVKAGVRVDKEISRYNRNITIEENTFLMYDDGTLLNAYCVDGITWQNNTIKKTTDYPARPESFKPFTINHCDNVRILE